MDFVKSLIATRGGQLASRYIGKGMLFLAGVLHMTPPADGYSHTSEEIGAFAVALVCFLIDRWSHNKQQEA